jgi:uncharacterized protein (DUF885 family)
VDRRRFMDQTARAALSFGILRQLGACHPAPPGGDDSRFIQLRDRYFLRSLELNPVTSTYLGGSGYSPALEKVDGGLRDLRPAALDQERRFYRGIQQDLARIPRDSLGSIARIDAAVLSAQLDFLLHQLDEVRSHERAIDSYVAEPFRGVDWQIQGMTEGVSGDAAQRGTDAEWNLVVARIGAIPAYVATAKANLLAGKSSGNLPDRRMVQRDGVAGSRANAEYFRTTLAASAKGFLGNRNTANSLLSRLGDAGAAAARAWEDFASFLEQTYDLNETTDRFAAGEREYQWRLAHCLRDSRSTAELFDYGAAQVSLYEGKIFAVAEEVAKAAGLRLRFTSDGERRTSVRAVMDWLSKDSPKNDDELFAWYRAAGERAVAYGREHALFDIPTDYRLDVTPTPPVLRSTIDAAYYPAPPFKKSGVGRFYLSPTGNDPAALRLNNRASIADTAVHEGFPGHDWHYKYMTQHGAEISNIRWLTPGAVEDSSSMWQDAMPSEGWALYSEELMAEPVEGRPHGFYSAAEHLYELQGQLLRAVRVRVDTGIHTGRMTFDDAVNYFAEHVQFMPGACARAESDPKARAVCEGATRAIYRYSKWPTQAITYNLGKNAIIELREASKKRLGDRFSGRDFHERLMRMGTIPAGYFRESFGAA